MSNNILITGGAGFVGVNIIDYFLKSGKYSITVLDNLSVGSFDLLERISSENGVKIVNARKENKKELLFIEGDVRDKNIVEKAVCNQNVIIHLAAETGVIPSLNDPEKDADVNIFGTLNLLKAAVKFKTKKFILASSAAPLGNQIPPNDEKKLPKPLSPYGASKLAGEGYCSAFYGSYALDTTVLRFSNVYGPNSYHKGSVVALFMKKILNNEDLTIYGDGEQTRDYLFVEDIAYVIEKVIDSEKTKGELYQLGTETETSINDLLKLLKIVTNKKINIVYKDRRNGEIERNYTSIHKISNHLNYFPRFNLTEGLKKTWDWFIDNYRDEKYTC